MLLHSKLFDDITSALSPLLLRRYPWVQATPWSYAECGNSQRMQHKNRTEERQI